MNQRIIVDKDSQHEWGKILSNLLFEMFWAQIPYPKYTTNLYALVSNGLDSKKNKECSELIFSHPSGIDLSTCVVWSAVKGSSFVAKGCCSELIWLKHCKREQNVLRQPGQPKRSIHLPVLSVWWSRITIQVNTMEAEEKQRTGSLGSGSLLWWKVRTSIKYFKRKNSTQKSYARFCNFLEPSQKGASLFFELIWCHQSFLRWF